MEQLALLEGFALKPRDEKGRFLAAPTPSRSVSKTEGNEVASIAKTEFLSGFGLKTYPNFSPVIRYRSNGQGIAFYDTMWFTDADLSGFFLNLNDDVLHCESVVQPASPSAEHRGHADFIIFWLKSLPQLQNIKRHFLSAHAFGFSVGEKMPAVVDRGQYQGAVIYADILDKPQRWFTFDADRQLRLVTTDKPEGELLPQEKFVVNTFGTNSNPWGEPVLDLCFWPWKLKHHAMMNQGIWFEKWASPTALGKYKWSPNATTNKENRDKLLDVLMTAQNDTAFAIPEGMEIALLESARSGAISFESYISQLTQVESRVVTGQLLSSMGLEGGSYALGKVHAKQEANKVEMLAGWLDGRMTTLMRELIDRNYGPQDAYPRHMTLAKSALERQAEATIQSSLQQLGVAFSKSYTERKFQVVTPIDKADTLVIPEGLRPGQTLPVSAQLALPATPEEPVVTLAANRELYEEAYNAATETRRKLDKIAADAAGAARPAIKKIVAGFASKIREKKSLKGITRAALLKGMRSGMGSMGKVYERMLDKSDGVDIAQMAEGDTPNISDAAKIGLALLALQILDRIIQAAQDAPEGMPPGDFADSLTDPGGLAIDEVFSNLYEGTHSTDISSIHTANLRRHLASPAFRAQFPYVMIVTQPDARLEHRVLDGYIMSAEEARFSDNLAPFGFGCRCVNVPLPDATARRRGLTGAAPSGSVEQFLREKGYSPRDLPFVGSQPGFLPAYSGTDARAQLALLRQKVEEIRRTSPAEWSSITTWLAWLFAIDILVEDPDLGEDAVEPAA